MAEQHILLAVFWIMFCALHSLLAGMRWKEKARQWLNRSYKYYRVGYTLFAFITFAGVLYYQIHITSPLLFPVSNMSIIAGCAVGLTGLVIMGVCIKKYFISLSGLKSLFTGNTSNTLIISGIHQYIRHPLYLGTFIFIWGLLIVFPYFSLLIMDVIITIYTLIGIGWEETKLIAEFGEDYKTYQQQVPMLLPSLRSKKG